MRAGRFTRVPICADGEMPELDGQTCLINGPGQFFLSGSGIPASRYTEKMPTCEGETRSIVVSRKEEPFSRPQPPFKVTLGRLLSAKEFEQRQNQKEKKENE
jgi:hypothetical protein